jgi:transcriptional regulator with XRE-family HTH domain
MQLIYPENMATDYGKRLRNAMAHAKINQKELIAATGLKQSTVSSAMNRSVGSSDTPAYAAACGVSALWLATGEGEMLITAEEHKPKQHLAPVEHAPAAIKEVADQSNPLKAMAALYDMLSPDQRNDAVKAATKAMAAFLSHVEPTFVNHENPSSHQGLPEFSHAATRNKAA